METLRGGSKTSGGAEKEGKSVQDPIAIIDHLEINEEFKKTVLEPYLEGVYESLIERTQTQFKGIPSYEFAEVLLIL